MNSEDRLNHIKLLVLEDLDFEVKLHEPVAIFYEIKQKGSLGDTTVDEIKSVLNQFDDEDVLAIIDINKNNKGNDEVQLIQSNNYESVLHDLRSKVEPSKDNGLVECVLRLEDVNLILKVGNNEEYVIAKVREDTTLFKLLAKVTGYPNFLVKNTDVYDSGAYKNLWSIISNARLAYLKPFFDTRTRGIIFKPIINVSKSKAEEIESGVSAKFRKK